MLEEIIQKVINHHPDFSYEDVNEICQEFLKDQPTKIKEETKLKRLNKYLEKEFELKQEKIEQTVQKEYSLETIPKYLFAGKTQISSSLINIS
jgi:DNA polymerase III delta prime subunit